MEVSSTTTTTVAFDSYDTTDKFTQNFSIANDSNRVLLECNQEINTNSLSDFIVYGIFVNLISLFGIIGNAISMIILSRPQMKSSINYLLIGLARCDTVLLLVSVNLPFHFYIVFASLLREWTLWRFSLKRRCSKVRETCGWKNQKRIKCKNSNDAWKIIIGNNDWPYNATRFICHHFCRTA